MINLKGFMSYARIPPDSDPEENEIASLCLYAAVDHAKSAGIPTEKLDATGSAKYELYIYALALHYFDNRGFSSSTQAYAADEYTKRMMRQMRRELESEALT